MARVFVMFGWMFAAVALCFSGQLSLAGDKSGCTCESEQHSQYDGDILADVSFRPLRGPSKQLLQQSRLIEARSVETTALLVFSERFPTLSPTQIRLAAQWPFSSRAVSQPRAPAFIS